jgi:hypothetical protein
MSLAKPLDSALEDLLRKKLPSLTAEEVYLQLCGLVAEMPDLTKDPIGPETNRWLGRACVLVEETGHATSILKTVCQTLNGPLREMHVQTITSTIHQALARAELNAPARVQGTFIAAGKTLDAYAAVGKVLGTADDDVLMIDPYADEKAVTDYAVLAPEKIMVRILADSAPHKLKKTLKPAASRWTQQFWKTRAPLEVRLAPADTLHDRLILIDGVTAWGLGQSFNKLAERSHTSLVQMNDETAMLKIGAYAAI